MSSLSTGREEPPPSHFNYGRDMLLCRVGMWRGGLRLRLHTPLIELDVRISRIQLSDKESCSRSHEAALPTLQAAQAQSLVEVRVGEP